ncbi:zinc-binding dehydrogenase [Streptomyces mirabilis]|uniref:zinc-binding dehydrogenase n=1 Tax=Streptomyces mirabilis TaxID=68239 RepID=UPI003D9E5F15
MASRLYVLGRWAVRRRGRFTAVWLLLLVAVGGLGITVHGKVASDFTVPGIESQRAQDLAFGADLALDPADPALADKVAAATRGAGIETAFDFAGVTPVREQALSVQADGGKLVLVGLSGKPVTIADSTTFSTRELRLLGHYGSGANAVAQLIHLAENGGLDFSRSISDVLPLEQAAEAVERLERKTGDPIRLVLRP